MTKAIAKGEDHTGSYKGLRRSVGVIGISLPIILIIAALTWLDRFEPSISHFFYQPFAGSLLVGALCAIGVFLGSYRGYRPQDDEWITDRSLGLITGLAAIGVAVFPTDGFRDQVTGVKLVTIVHFISAAVFLFCLGCFSCFKFVRSGSEPDALDRDKVSRNRIYRGCGVIIFASIVIMGALKFLKIDFPLPNWMFWFESIAVWAFGVSWLVKGEALDGAIVMISRSSEKAG